MLLQVAPKITNIKLLFTTPNYQISIRDIVEKAKYFIPDNVKFKKAKLSINSHLASLLHDSRAGKSRFWDHIRAGADMLVIRSLSKVPSCLVGSPAKRQEPWIFHTRKLDINGKVWFLWFIGQATCFCPPRTVVKLWLAYNCQMTYHEIACESPSLILSPRS